MAYFDEALDELAYEAAATVAHPRRCNCPACRQGAHARVVRHSGCGCGGHGFDETAGITPAGRQTPSSAVGPQLPLWRGWGPPATLSSIIIARDSRVVPPALAPFFVVGNQVYRITRAGLDRDRPLSIGMTKWHKSIAQRVIEHYSGSPPGDGPVHRAIRGMPTLQILVQAARIQPVDMHPRRTRLYEGWLQDYERPLLYNRDTTTFDEAARRNPPLTGGYDA